MQNNNYHTNFGVSEYTIEIFLNLIMQNRKKWIILLNNFFDTDIQNIHTKAAFEHEQKKLNM